MITPRQVARLAARWNGPDTTWCYLGIHVATRRRVERMLASARSVSLRDELTRTAYALKQPFLDWLVEIERRQTHRERWYASRLATKSPLETDFFLVFCYTHLVQSWVARDQGPRIIVIEDPWVVLWVKRAVRGARCATLPFDGWWEVIWDVLYWLLRIPFAVVDGLRLSLSAWWLSRRWLPRPVRSRGGRAQAVLLYSWIVPRCFGVPGQFSDPFTGRLEEILRTHGGERVGRITPLKIPGALLRRLRPFRGQFLLTAHDLTLADILRSFGRRAWIDHLRPLASFQGSDYTLLFMRELLREWGMPSFAFYWLWYRATRRMAQREGPGVKQVIYPFENQAWEKLFCLAWREAAPHVQLVGYQHSWVPPLLLPYALGRGELETSSLPDWIVTNGPFNRRCLEAGGFPSARLVNGGAFRHEYFHRQPSARGVPPQDPTGHHQPTALVTLPCSAPESAELFAALCEAFQTPLLLGGRTVVHFLVKCHPQMSPPMFGAGQTRLPPWITLSDRPMEELMPVADLLLYVGPTSSWWEAALSGLPVFKYLPDFWDLDAGHDLEGLGVRLCHRETLRSTLTTFFRQPSPPRTLPDERLVCLLFDRVQERVWVDLAAGRSPLSGEAAPTGTAYADACGRDWADDSPLESR